MRLGQLLQMNVTWALSSHEGTFSIFFPQLQVTIVIFGGGVDG